MQITRRVACRMTPLQLQLYLDVLAKDFDKVNAMGETSELFGGPWLLVSNLTG